MPKAGLLWRCFKAGSGPLMINGALTGDVEQVEQALNHDPLLVLYRGRGGLEDTAWHCAASNGHVNVLRVLLTHVVKNAPLIGRELTFRTDDITHWSRDYVVRHVINQLNIKGQTPLMFACLAGQAECVEFLIGVSAHAWAHDYCGRRTALHYAALHGHTSCIAAILDRLPANELVRIPSGRRRLRPMHMLINQVTASGFTPLHFAAYSKKPGAIKALLDRGANPHSVSLSVDVHDIITCPRWTTPLHVAAYAGFTAGAMEILAHYLSTRDTGQFRDPRRSGDRASRLPYHVAALHGHTQLSIILRPSYSFTNIFPAEQVPHLGVVKLSIIASQVLQQHLLAMVDTADVRLAEMNDSKQTDVALDVILDDGTTRVDGRRDKVSLHTTAQTSSNTASGEEASRAEPQPSASSTYAGRTFRLGLLRRFNVTFKRADGDTGEQDRSAGVSTSGALPQSDSMCCEGRDAGVCGTSFTLDARPSHPSATRGSSMQLQQDWWAPAQTNTEPRQLTGAPVPSDRRMGEGTTASYQQNQGLLQQLRSRFSLIGKDGTAVISPECAHTMSSPPHVLSRESPGRHTTSAAAVSVVHAVQVSTHAHVQTPEDDMSSTSSAPISWGTTGMIAKLPIHDTCSVCLEDVEALVMAPCLHRLCASCSRQLILGLKDRPLACPVCRVCTRGFFAPRDQQALQAALPPV